MVRNISDFDSPKPTSFWYLIKDSFGDMQELSTNTRNQVRRGLKNYYIRQIDAQLLMNHGYSIMCDAVAGYKKATTTTTREQFVSRLKEANNEYWGAFDERDDRLVAFAINKVAMDYCNYETLKAYPQAVKQYVYYALIHEMNRYYLQEKGLRYVTDGTRSITEHSNIQTFLQEKFHFRPAFCKLQITYTWWLRFFVNVLYPFRKYINHPSIAALLRQEAMQRNELNNE